MMTIEQIQPFLRAQPFRALKVVTARNGTFDVAAPGHVLLTTTQLIIGRDLVGDGVPAKVSTIPLVQLVRIEPAD